MKILGISGKKQSGKNTVFNYLLALEMLKLSIVREKALIMPNGKIHISDIFGDKEFEGTFDIERHTEFMAAFATEYIYPTIRNYSYASELKDFIMDKFMVPREQLYGSDAEKEMPTHLMWEDMPGVISEDRCREIGEKYSNVATADLAGILLDAGIIVKSGYMTGRDIMKHFGTNICRKIYRGCWVESTLNKIKAQGSEFAIITDVRFPDEVDEIIEAGGKVIRLTRNPLNDDHESENVLNPDVYDYSKFSAVIDNATMSIPEQSEAVINQLQQWNWA